MTLQRLSQLKDLDGLYEKIETSNNLLLSLKIKYLHIDGEWPIIQFLSTWSNYNPEGTINLYPESMIQNAKNRNIALVIAYLNNMVLLNDEDCSEDIKNNYSEYENLMNGDINEYISDEKGKDLSFVCISGAKNEFLHHFYGPNEVDNSGRLKFKDRGAFMDFVTYLLKTIMSSPTTLPSKKNKWKQDQARYKRVAETCYELFHNTDHHGRYDVKGQELKYPSIRTFSVRFVADYNRPKDFETTARQLDPFQRFMDDYKLFFRISIFDNGEGILKKYYESLNPGKKLSDLTREEQEDVFEQVFKLGATSERASNTSSGMGLYIAKNEITKLQGALTIETNGMAYSYIPDEEEKHQVEINEIPSRDGTLGTLITILIPLQDR